jgi:hypothetical protein
MARRVPHTAGSARVGPSLTYVIGFFVMLAVIGWHPAPAALELLALSKRDCIPD